MRHEDLGISEVLIVGTGPAGLAVGACLRRTGVSFALLERDSQVASAWRWHYDRLRLHTVKQLSSLPYRALPSHLPRYVARADFVAYLESYARAFSLEPMFSSEVSSIVAGDGIWNVRAGDVVHRARRLVVATGYNRTPRIPAWPGLEDFRGERMHSRDYRNGAAFSGRRVLVAGAGNSGAEIAIDLVEHGAATLLCVRSPIHVIPREHLGLPAQVSGLLVSCLPRRLGDLASRIVSFAAIGDLSRYGIDRPRAGLVTQIAELGRVPVIDVGTVRLIRQGQIRVVGAVERFTPTGAVLADGAELPLDAVVMATGYRSGLDEFLDCAAEVTDRCGYPRDHGVESAAAGAPGLYFVGYRNPITGQLRDIGRKAKRVAADIARKSRD